MVAAIFLFLIAGTNIAVVAIMARYLQSHFYLVIYISSVVDLDPSGSTLLFRRSEIATLDPS